MVNITQEEIMQNWGVDNADNPLVSVKCMTYNHENYISQCIEGFLRQKTKFPFEILIHDDCSTDSTANIVAEYAKKFPKIIKPIYEEENLYSKNDGSHHKKIDAAIKGKYLAICEGDDYWINSNKLQMQVEFLEKHQDYGACYTYARGFDQKTLSFTKKIGGKEPSFKNIFVHGNMIPNLTSCVRMDLYKNYEHSINPGEKKWLLGDLPKWLWFSKNCKIKCMAKVTAIYRVLQNSASHSVDINRQIAFDQSCKDIRQFFSELYDREDLYRIYLANIRFDNAWKNKDFLEMKCSFKDLSYREITIKMIIKYLVCFLQKNRSKRK